MKKKAERKRRCERRPRRWTAGPVRGAVGTSQGPRLRSLRPSTCGKQDAAKTAPARAGTRGSGVRSSPAAERRQFPFLRGREYSNLFRLKGCVSFPPVRSRTKSSVGGRTCRSLTALSIVPVADPAPLPWTAGLRVPSASLRGCAPPRLLCPAALYNGYFRAPASLPLGIEIAVHVPRLGLGLPLERPC